MRRWIARHNIEDFEIKLAAERDEAKRQLLAELIAQERLRDRDETAKVS